MAEAKCICRQRQVHAASAPFAWALPTSQSAGGLIVLASHRVGACPWYRPASLLYPPCNSLATTFAPHRRCHVWPPPIALHCRRNGPRPADTRPAAVGHTNHGRWTHAHRPRADWMGALLPWDKPVEQLPKPCLAHVVARLWWFLRHPIPAAGALE